MVCAVGETKIKGCLICFSFCWVLVCLLFSLFNLFQTFCVERHHRQKKKKNIRLLKIIYIQWRRQGGNMPPLTLKNSLHLVQFFLILFIMPPYKQLICASLSKKFSNAPHYEVEDLQFHTISLTKRKEKPHTKK